MKVRRRILATLVSFVLVAGLSAALTGGTAIGAVNNWPHSSINLKFRGTVNLSATVNASANSGGQMSAHEIRYDPRETFKEASEHRAGKQLATSSIPVPSPPSTTISADQLPGFAGWDSLSHRDQRYANNGQQFSLEPPDQGVCASTDFVMAGVNTAEQIYDAGSPFGVVGTQKLVALITENQFFLFPPELTRPDPTGGGGPPFGPFLSDPKCYFDKDTNRWFHTILKIEQDVNTGAFLPSAQTELAVSKGPDPTKTWNIYEFNSTDANRPNCPCFGDQPLIGADKYGFYVSTAEYSFDCFGGGCGFNGPQVYAFPKGQLAAGATGIKGTHWFNLHAGTQAGCYLSGTLQPATSPQGQYRTANNGTEFLMQSTDTVPCDPFGTEGSGPFNRLIVWAITNTKSLGTANPNPFLTGLGISSQAYALPVRVPVQRAPAPPDGQRRPHEPGRLRPRAAVGRHEHQGQPGTTRRPRLVPGLGGDRQQQQRHGQHRQPGLPGQQQRGPVVPLDRGEQGRKWDHRVLAHGQELLPIRRLRADRPHPPRQHLHRRCGLLRGRRVLVLPGVRASVLPLG